jgi:hypothetical protein
MSSVVTVHIAKAASLFLTINLLEWVWRFDERLFP